MIWSELKLFLLIYSLAHRRSFNVVRTPGRLPKRMFVNLSPQIIILNFVMLLLSAHTPAGGYPQTIKILIGNYTSEFDASNFDSCFVSYI